MELYLKLKDLLFKQGTEALLPQNLSDAILNDFHKLYSDAKKNQSVESLNPYLFYVSMFRNYNEGALNTIPFRLTVKSSADIERDIEFFQSNPDVAQELVTIIGNLSDRFEMEIRRRQEPWRVWALTTKENILMPPGLKDAIKVVEIQKEQAIRLYKSIKEGFGEEWLSNVYGIIILANKTSAIRIDNTSIKSIDSKEFLTPEEKEFGGTAFFFAERDEGTVIQVYYGDRGNIQSYLTPIQGMKLT
jgi:hypothetical protein